MVRGGVKNIKVLDVQQLHNEMEQTTADLERLMEEIKQIQMKLDGFVAMEDAFKGKAANAVRAFYQESHMPLLVFMEGFITDFQDALAKIKHSLASLEPDEQGYIHEAFLQEDVKKGLKNAENVTMSLTDEANRVISTVSDILPLPSVNDSDFLDQAQRARKKVDHTLEKLYTFDSESTRALERPQNDLDLMQTYIHELGGMVSRGKSA
jgi:predicted ribonuclease toxin of YeeF-YezG toxin-antitoxin module